MIGDIWVFAEQKEGKVTETSQEVICEGKRIADQAKEKLVVVLMGDKIQAAAQSLSSFGVKIVFAADHETLASYRAELYTAILAGLVREFNPWILLFGSTVVEKDLAPRVAAKLRTSLVTDCDKLQITNDGQILQTRLMYQKKVHATFASPGARPLMVTVAQGIAKVKKFSPSDGFSINGVDPLSYMSMDAEKLTPPRFIKADPKTIDITEADFIVSGGKGAGDDEGFQRVRDLADALGAALAGSRVAVDNHWVGKERQIGQSGKTVSPEVMISCGISGATAHMFGMNDTQTLIAINKDKAAPIMKRADLGIPGDLNEIIPELIKQLKRKT